MPASHRNYTDVLFSGGCVPKVSLENWPPIKFKLTGAEVTLPPKGYLIKKDAGYCLGIVNMGWGPSAMFIIGDTVLYDTMHEYV